MLSAAKREEEDVYTLLYTGQPVYDWETGDPIGRVKSVSQGRGRLEYEVEFRSGDVAKHDESSLYVTSSGIVLLPPDLRETNRILYELGNLWKRISELDNLFYSGQITEEKLDEKMAELLVQSDPLEERIEKDRVDLQGIKEKMDRARKLIYNETLELQARFLLNEVSQEDRDSKLADLRRRNSFLSMRVQVFETVLKKIGEMRTFIRARTRVRTWRTDRVTGILIKGTRESEEESARGDRKAEEESV